MHWPSFIVGAVGIPLVVAAVTEVYFAWKNRHESNVIKETENG